MTHRISPPLTPKPKALPSYLTNGGSPLQNRVSVRDTSERDTLFSSIKSSSGPRRQPIALEQLPSPVQQGPPALKGATMNGVYGKVEEREHIVQEYARDPRDEAPMSPTLSTNSRPASPFTANPTVDFDGLSWPSMGTKERLEATPEEARARLEKLTGAVKTILECVGRVIHVANTARLINRHADLRR